MRRARYNLGLKPNGIMHCASQLKREALEESSRFSLCGLLSSSSNLSSSGLVGWAAGCDGERGLEIKQFPLVLYVLCIEALRVNGPAEKNVHTMKLAIKAVFVSFC